MSQPRICLNMIVKDEAHVIRECLASVAPYIHSWVVCDTGSTDGTQRVVTDFFKARGIPGELHEQPWVNFGHNRSEAIRVARGKADYIWIMDADDLLHGAPDFSGLTQDACMLRFGRDFTYWRQQVFRDGLDWRYLGVVHEYAHLDRPYSVGKVEGEYFIEPRHLGSRSRDPEKYRKDALLIEEVLKTEPENTRYWFYLGQSWYSAADFRRARDAYRHRASMDGWPEEVFYSRYREGQCALALGEEAETLRCMLTTFEAFPHRAEPLHVLAKYAMERPWHRLGYEFASIGTRIPFPPDILFVESDVYRWRLLDIMAVCGYYVGRRGESLEINQRLLGIAPPGEHERIRRNLAFCVGKA